MTAPTGRPVGRPKGSGRQTERVEFRCSPSLLARIKAAAAEDEVTIGYWLRRAVVSSVRWRTRREEE